MTRTAFFGMAAGDTDFLHPTPLQLNVNRRANCADAFVKALDFVVVCSKWGSTLQYGHSKFPHKIMASLISSGCKRPYNYLLG